LNRNLRLLQALVPKKQGFFKNLNKNLKTFQKYFKNFEILKTF